MSSNRIQGDVVDEYRKTRHRADSSDAIKRAKEEHAKLAADLARLEAEAKDEASLFGLLPKEKAEERDPTRTTCFVGNLSYELTEEDLRELFETYGAVKGVRLPPNKDGSGRPSGIAFVEFGDAAHARAARDGLHGEHVVGLVEEARKIV